MSDSDAIAPAGPAPGAVAYVVSQYPATSHTFVHREVRALRALGVDVHTFSVNRPDPPERLSAQDAAELGSTRVLLDRSWPRQALRVLRLLAVHGPAAAAVLRSALRRTPGTRARVMQAMYLLEALLVFDALRGTGVRHVHAHFANNGSDIARSTAELGRAAGERWTWSFTMHGPTEFSDVAAFGLARKAVDADLVVCISDYARSQLMALVPPEAWERFTVVRCGLELPAWPLRERPSSTGAFRVLCVGRLVPVKGQALLVDAVALAAQRGLHIQLVLVGDGPDRRRLEARAEALGIASSVTFEGAVGADRVAALLQDADAFVLPSFQEGLPVVLMEALATGVPVVTTRVMGIPELVEDGVTGLLLSPGRVDELVRALERLATDAGLRDRLVESGRERVERQHDVRREAQTLARCFAALQSAPALEPAPAGTDRPGAGAGR